MRQHPLSLHPRGGFSLVELLVVIALVAMLAALGLSQMGWDNQRRAILAGAEEIRGILQLARWEARSKATYAYVCFRRVEAPEGGLEVAVFTTLDGSANPAADNLAMAAAVRRLRGVDLLEADEPTDGRLVAEYAAAGMDPATLGRLAGSSVEVRGPAGATYSDRILSFSPRGVPAIPGATTPAGIEMVIVAEGGGSAPEKSAAIAVARSTGLPRLFR